MYLHDSSYVHWCCQIEAVQFKKLLRERLHLNRLTGVGVDIVSKYGDKMRILLAMNIPKSRLVHTYFDMNQPETDIDKLKMTYMYKLIEINLFYIDMRLYTDRACCFKNISLMGLHCRSILVVKIKKNYSI